MSDQKRAVEKEVGTCEPRVIDESATKSTSTPINSKARAPIPTHCPYRQSSSMQQALAPDKMKVAFFLGAGCPVSIRVPEGTGTKPLIPDIATLTKLIRGTFAAPNSRSGSFDKIIARLSRTGKSEPTIEEILTHIRSLIVVAHGGDIDELSKEDLENLDESICEEITKHVSVPLPGKSTPYHHLATWIRSIPRTYPVQIFTANYDLLMEQALEQLHVPYFDGFIGTNRTFFDVASMEMDNLPPRWARLWKIHGSINWWRSADGNIERRRREPDDKCQMIYPSHLKYDQTRRLPYLAMFDRLKAFLSEGQAVLITCGYSFSDTHLNEVIVEGLQGNPNAVCFSAIYDDRAKYPLAIEAATKVSNLRLLAVDGAILNTLERDWTSEIQHEHPLHSIAVSNDVPSFRTNAEKSRSKFLLGDFASLGRFLAEQLSPADESENRG